MKLTILTLFTLFLILGCAKNHDEVFIENAQLPFVGTWINSQFTDTTYTITRSSEFVETSDGFKIKSDGTFIQRAYSGWCGTPPISYSNYNGTWTKFPDNTLFIETEYWGGVTSFKIEILEVTRDKMVYKILYDTN